MLEFTLKVKCRRKPGEGAKKQQDMEADDPRRLYSHSQGKVVL